MTDTVRSTSHENLLHDELRVLRNLTFDEISIGDSAAMERTLSTEDIQLFAVMSGDVNPQHLDPEFAASTQFHGVIAHGMWGAALISAVLGTRLPGPGTVYLAQTLRFLHPVRVGDTLTISVTVTAREPDNKRLSLRCSCINQDGKIVIEGDADVIAPSEKIVYSRTTLPEVRISSGDKVQRLLEHVRPLSAIRVAVVHPCDELSLSAALDARQARLIEPLLVAPRAKLEAVAAAAGLDLTGIAIEDVPHSHAAAARAAEMAGKGEVEALMKGSLHTDELMAAVLAASAGLRTKRRISHCYLMQTAAYPRPFIISDAAINIEPTLDDKVDIVRNAIDLAHVIGVACPRVAILAAVETVNPSMRATLDAAVLCKMADRGQITGAILDGPLAFDNAVSVAAARIKGIVSEVAGRADILIVPDLESGNMLAKQLEYLSDAASAGIVLGAKVPIILTSRADSRETRIASCAIALMLAHHYRDHPQ
ncbi:phosphate acetyltransferase [Collimonas sp. OK307]|uniref:bifunctional enoyl-CoA hydratase/phosphate acetyltransferase n=1 Tax=Collimonas sp. OK307 TaxID=1801620 RepID=UPI0008E5E948|nr:bifunctional enoyl-CoA hydratase/phosphate acetyltransferase [Collimonas sp. OK307]SFI36117.1 phosphate acetyltransferase [Collimonas sp. OK307]